MDGVNINIGMFFRQRIVPGIYQFDIVITNPPYCGAIIGSIICGKEKNMISIPSELEKHREEITKKTYKAYKALKEMLGD